MPYYMHLKKKVVAVASLAEASAIYSAARDKSGSGASRWPTAEVYHDGEHVARVSYNGKVWAAGPWTPATELLFNPYSQ